MSDQEIEESNDGHESGELDSDKSDQERHNSENITKKRKMENSKAKRCSIED